MGLLDFAADVAGAVYGNYASAKAATKSFDRDVYMMSNRYQLQVEDLKKAGLNPMLAVGASPPAPNAPMAQMRAPELGRAASAGQAVAATKALEAEAELKKAMAETERNRPENVAAGTQRDIASADQARQQTENLKAELAKIQAEIARLVAETKESGARTETIERMRDLDARLKALEAMERNYRMPEAQLRGKAAEKVIRTDEVAGPTAESIGRWVGGKIADMRDQINEAVNEYRTRPGRERRKKARK